MGRGGQTRSGDLLWDHIPHYVMLNGPPGRIKERGGSDHIAEQGAKTTYTAKAGSTMLFFSVAS